MKHVRSLLFVSLAVFGLALTGLAQTSGEFVVVYAQPNFQGPAMAIHGDWAGNRDWDGSPHRILSIKVPAGWKLTLYPERNFGQSTSITTITESISWAPGQFWYGRTRSIRVEKSWRPPTPAPNSFPVVYAQNNFNGPAMAIERDWAGHRDWEGNPHRIRSILVPPGWFITVYTKRNFRGNSYNVSSDWAPMPGDTWYGKIRSIKVFRGAPPIQPR